jgi:hypothetical protein
MSQQTEILELLRNAANRTVSCQTLADHYLYHKAASRISKLNQQGFHIQFNKSQTKSPMNGSYTLVFDKDYDVCDDKGQYEFGQMAARR